MTAEEVLSASADLIEQSGWCQRSWDGPNGEHCLHGAVGTFIRFSREACLKAWQAVCQETRPHHPMTFNDCYCTSAEEAVATLRNAKRWL